MQLSWKPFGNGLLKSKNMNFLRINKIQFNYLKIQLLKNIIIKNRTPKGIFRIHAEFWIDLIKVITATLPSHRTPPPKNDYKQWRGKSSFLIWTL